MKFPSIFRLPRHQRFEIQPRYYDPVKEDLDKRTARIRQEIKNESNGGSVESIREAYRNRRSSNRSADLFQLLMIVIVGLSIGGYLMYGANVYFALFLLIPLYIILRKRRS
ncbi:hypothetical protein [Marivirga arenosa]|uniref:Uncharacterized protein n=1 Tax=Marivirga arenosa TaxID=3059076 RepID=A0AA49GFG5_9BACT|nr:MULTISPECIES: hypothetical protein [unclassified Marivirga]WKK79607.2 hypothetical protein QYS47_19925 [Marivirga sp. BKB1-2]WKK85313.1 hypothetical protein QYS48_25760 [Marivirga sp. ABR2-2]